MELNRILKSKSTLIYDYYREYFTPRAGKGKDTPEFFCLFPFYRLRDICRGSYLSLLTAVNYVE